MRRFIRGLVGSMAFFSLGAANATVVVQKGDDADMILTVLASEPGGRANATFICNGGKSEFGVVLGAGSGPALPEGGADVTIKADAAVLGQQHFDLFRKTLMLTINGPSGRSLFEKAMGASTIELDVSGTPYRFPLDDGKAAIARYKTACGL